MARAKIYPNIIFQQTIAEKEGILAANEYMPGDFVSMDQFVAKTLDIYRLVLAENPN